MSETTAHIRRKIGSASDLGSVVRTMKALAASSIGQYEKSVRALDDYYKTVELGLGACIREIGPETLIKNKPVKSQKGLIAVIVFGSDQGLVGQFNEVLTTYVVEAFASSRDRIKIWVVGERIYARLLDAGLAPTSLFALPNSVVAIAPLIAQLQIESDMYQVNDKYESIYVFHNRPQIGGLYQPVSQKLLPLDAHWQLKLAEVPWPNKNLSEIFGGAVETLPVLIREYLFISLFRACAESLASENASRLAAMQRAEKNIDELLEDLKSRFNHLRQSSIDEELFDVISGFNSLGKEAKPGSKSY